MQFFCCSTNLVLENQASVNHEINFIFLVRTFMYVKKERKKDVFSYFSLNLNVNDFLLMSESQVYLCLGVFDLSYIIGKHLGVNARQSFKHIFCLSFRLRQNSSLRNSATRRSTIQLHQEKDISERLRTNAKKKFHLPITKVALIRSTKLGNYLINRNFWLLAYL